MLIGAVAKTNRVTTEPHTTWTSLPFINIVTRGKQSRGGKGVRENMNAAIILFLKTTYDFVSLIDKISDSSFLS